MISTYQLIYPNIHALKHIANDNAPMTNAQHIEYLWAILLDTYTQRIEATI